MPATRLLILSLTAWFSLALATANARADDSVRLYVDGECPGSANLDAALGAEAVTVTTASAPWTIKVESSGGTSRLTVEHSERGRIAERETASDDCAAIAEAFALIIKGLLSVPEPVPAPSSVPAGGEGHVRDSPPAGAGDFGGPGSVEPELFAAVPVPASARPRFSVGIAGGMDMRFDDTRARLVELDIAFPLGRSAGVRVIVDLGEHVSQYDDIVSIDRRQSAVRGEVQTAAHSGALWLSVGAGGGLSLSTVGASTAEGHPVVTRLHPVLSSTLMVGAHATRSISVRAQVGLDVFPVTDRYVTATMGEIAQSPRAALSIGVGLQFDMAK